MPKSEVTKVNVYDKPTYKSILNLLLNFEGKDGLQLRHFRYALIKDHDHMPEDYISDVELKIKPDELNKLFSSGEIVQGRFKSKHNISMCLKILLDDDEGIGMIKHHGNYKIPHYKLTIQGSILTARESHIENFKDFENKDIILFDKGRLILYGFNRDLYKEAPDSKMFEEHIKGIKKHLHALQQLQDGTLLSWQDRIINKINGMIKESHTLSEDKALRKLIDTLNNSKEREEFYRCVVCSIERNNEICWPFIFGVLQVQYKLTKQQSTRLTNYLFQVISDFRSVCECGGTEPLCLSIC